MEVLSRIWFSLEDPARHQLHHLRARTRPLHLCEVARRALPGVLDLDGPAGLGREARGDGLPAEPAAAGRLRDDGGREPGRADRRARRADVEGGLCALPDFRRRDGDEFRVGVPDHDPVVPGGERGGGAAGGRRAAGDERVGERDPGRGQNRSPLSSVTRGRPHFPAPDYGERAAGHPWINRDFVTRSAHGPVWALPAAGVGAACLRAQTALAASVFGPCV